MFIITQVATLPPNLKITVKCHPFDTFGQDRLEGKIITRLACDNNVDGDSSLRSE
jgi:hypothetical protein